MRCSVTESADDAGTVRGCDSHVTINVPSLVMASGSDPLGGRVLKLS